MKTDKGFFTFRKISLSLHKKILLSYLCLLILTCGLVSIIFVERAKVRESERILKSINTVRRSIDDVHFAIIRLCTKGESVISWDNSDFNIYHQYRLSVDSLLQDMKVKCSGFVLPHQIDSLCDLLYKKEINLGYIMNTVKSREKSDSIFANKLPVIAKETVRMKTISQKKKGIAGLFGKKEIVQIPYYTNELRTFNDKLIVCVYRTLDEFEAEANFFASVTLFQHDRFTSAISKYPLDIDTPIQLSTFFGASIHATLRRYVEYSNNRCALLVLEKPSKCGALLRNQFQSPSFTSTFGEMNIPNVLDYFAWPFVQDYIRKQNHIKDGTFSFFTSNGLTQFTYHFFNNSYNAFVLIFPDGERNIVKSSYFLN